MRGVCGWTVSKDEAGGTSASLERQAFIVKPDGYTVSGQEGAKLRYGSFK
jgi:hypothetical protein